MKFSEILNNYIEQLDCKAKDICEKSDISAATLSRYRSGERLPDPNSETLKRLCAAISEIARERCIEGICEEQILEEFSNTEDFESLDTKQLFENFDMLVNFLNININKLCRYINYDVSTVFRFRNGTRKPAEPKKFAFAVAGYIVREFDSAKDISVLSKLLVCSEEEIADNSIRFDRLTNWMLSEKAENKTSVSSFLNTDTKRIAQRGHRYQRVPYSENIEEIWIGCKKRKDRQTETAQTYRGTIHRRKSNKR